MDNKTESYILKCEFLESWYEKRYGFTKYIFPTNAAMIVFICINALLTVTSAVSNFVVTTALWKFRKQREPSLFLVAYLSLVDLLHAVTSQPLFVVVFISVKVEKTLSYGCILNKCSLAAALIFNGTSLLMVTAISVDKYLALKLHLRYNHYVTRKRFNCAVVISFAISTAVAATRFLPNLIIFEISLMLFLISGIVLTSFTSAVVYRSVKNHNKRIRAQQFNSIAYCANLRRHERSTNTTLYIMAACIVCFFPYAVVIFFVRNSIFTNYLPIMHLVVRTLLNGNSAVNPFLYCYRLRRIRYIVQETLNDVLPGFCLKVGCFLKKQKSKIRDGSAGVAIKF